MKSRGSARPSEANTDKFKGDETATRGRPSGSVPSGRDVMNVATRRMYEREATRQLNETEYVATGDELERVVDEARASPQGVIRDAVHDAVGLVCEVDASVFTSDENENEDGDES